MRKKIHLQLSRKRWQKVRAGRKKLAKSVAAEKVARKRGKVGPIAGPRKRTNICTPPYHTPISTIRSYSHQSHLNRESRLTTLVIGEQGGFHIVAKLTGFPLCEVIGRCPVHHHEDGDPRTKLEGRPFALYSQIISSVSKKCPVRQP